MNKIEMGMTSQDLKLYCIYHLYSNVDGVAALTLVVSTSNLLGSEIPVSSQGTTPVDPVPNVENLVFTP